MKIDGESFSVLDSHSAAVRHVVTGTACRRWKRGCSVRQLLAFLFMYMYANAQCGSGG